MSGASHLFQPDNTHSPSGGVGSGGDGGGGGGRVVRRVIISGVGT